MMARTSTVPSKIHSPSKNDSKQSFNQSSDSTTLIRCKVSNPNISNLNSNWFVSKLFLERVKV